MIYKSSRLLLQCHFYYFKVIIIQVIIITSMSFFKKEDISAGRGTVICQRFKKKAKRWQSDVHLQSPRTPGPGLSISLTAPLLIPLPKTSVEVGDIQLASQLPFPKSQANVGYSQCAYPI